MSPLRKICRTDVQIRNMKPIPFYVFPRKQVQSIAPLSPSFLAEWESVRPGVLDDNSIDIFLPNIRSKKHPTTRFDLFNRVENVDSGTVIVCNSWLELLSADGRHHDISVLMNAIRSEFPHNPKVWSWNSDRDESTVPELHDLPENEFILSYNTSRPSPNDILIPFWTIECRHPINIEMQRPWRGGFIGYVGGLKLRQKMVEAFRSKEGWMVDDADKIGRLVESDYLWQMRHWDFALCPRGGGLSSYRFFEAIHAGCVPVLFADDVALPYPDLPWGELICRIPEKDAGNFDLVWDLIGGIDVKARRKTLSEVKQRFTLTRVQQEIFTRLSEYPS